MIYGNVEGIRKTIINRLEELYEYKIEKDVLVSEEVVDLICEITSIIGREISIAIDRRGKIIFVAIGDSSTVELPQIELKEKRLSGVRIVHTHPNGIPYLSEMDISAMMQMKLDCIVAAAVKDNKFYAGTIGFCKLKDGEIVHEEYPKLSKDKFLNFNFLYKVEEIQKDFNSTLIEEKEIEKAILVGIENMESLDELEELGNACGVKTLFKVIQNRIKIDSTFYIGQGKVAEIAALRQRIGANLIIFDDELSSSQLRNLEIFTGTKVIDRTSLILEIFARRAQSREAKIQVELAQLKYRLPRLSGMGDVLSRTGAGIGTRGPGEKKLEIDKRRIRERVFDLNKQLIKIKNVREVQRGRRNKDNIPKVSIVGYTNAGKSTLRNKMVKLYSKDEGNLEGKSVFEADMLFATLDVTTRGIRLNDNRVVTLTDTVGFVRKLPHDLVEAFKSTLEEVVFADLLIHVVDSSSEKILEQIDTVNKVLEELGVKDKKIILVLNKIDKEKNEKLVGQVESLYSNCPILKISAINELNLDMMIEQIERNLPNNLKKVKFMVPYSKQAIVSSIHNNANVEIEDFKDNGTEIVAFVDNEIYNKYNEYIIEEM
ncbi:GTPase HflX [Clostridium sp. DL1XJH146]